MPERGLLQCLQGQVFTQVCAPDAAPAAHARFIVRRSTSEPHTPFVEATNAYISFHLSSSVLLSLPVLTCLSSVRSILRSFPQLTFTNQDDLMHRIQNLYNRLDLDESGGASPSSPLPSFHPLLPTTASSPGHRCRTSIPSLPLLLACD